MILYKRISLDCQFHTLFKPKQSAMRYIRIPSEKSLFLTPTKNQANANPGIHAPEPVGARTRPCVDPCANSYLRASLRRLFDLRYESRMEPRRKESLNDSFFKVLAFDIKNVHERPYCHLNIEK